jgi:hypothetical protein
MAMIQTRRRFLSTLSLAGAAGFVGAAPGLAAEGPPETTTVRLVRDPGICLAPQYAAEELLRAEGLTDIRYLEGPSDADTAQMVARGEGDFTLNFASQFVALIDRGAPLTVLAGVHVGCFELFASDAIGKISDLRGKSIGAQALGSSAQVFLGALAAGIGLDPSARFAGSPTRAKIRSNCSWRARSTLISRLRPSLRSCAPEVSATLFSIVLSTGRGRNISAACSRAMPSSSAKTRP